MKTLLLISCLFFTQLGNAKSAPAPANYTQETLSDGSWNGENSMYFQLIPYAKSAGFGIGYEKNLSSSVGLGGNTHSFT